MNESQGHADRHGTRSDVELVCELVTLRALALAQGNEEDAASDDDADELLDDYVKSAARLIVEAVALRNGTPAPLDVEAGWLTGGGRLLTFGDAELADAFDAADERWRARSAGA